MSNSKYILLTNNSKYNLVKIIIIGNSGIGKSSLLTRYIDFNNVTNEKFDINLTLRATIPTIGVDFKVKRIENEHGFFKIQLWDTAGQYTYRNIVNSYFRMSNVSILCYDIHDTHSSSETISTIINSWIDGIANYNTNDNIVIYLLGMKLDTLEYPEQLCDVLEQINMVNTSSDYILKPIGICSAKDDTFISHSNIRNICESINNKDDRDDILNHIDNSKQCVSEMFEYIFNDYIGNYYVYDNDDNIDNDTIIIGNNKRKNCCLIL